MKAVAVIPGQANSIHLAELPKPSVHEIPNGRGVLVQVLRVGVDGTDKEINAAEYGMAPPGDDFLVIGHECLGRVLEVGPAVSEFAPGDYVVPTVRRPGGSFYDQIGQYDMTSEDTYFERGINLRHGYPRILHHFLGDLPIRHMAQGHPNQCAVMFVDQLAERTLITGAESGKEGPLCLRGRRACRNDRRFSGQQGLPRRFVIGGDG